MRTISALSSPLPINNVTDKITTGAQGSELGGAIVPGNSCFCNCGLTASLDCGTISWTYYSETSFDDYGSGTLTYRDYWEFIDSGDSVIGNGLYLATLAFSSTEESCEPYVNIWADTFDPYGEFHSISVLPSGVGTFYYYYINNGQVIPAEGATRPGVIIASAYGVYGDDPEIEYYVTVEKSTPVEWRPSV